MRPPKVDPRYGQGTPLPRAQDADYSDEISARQHKSLLCYSEQDEAKMGPVVDEITW